MKHSQAQKHLFHVACLLASVLLWQACSEDPATGPIGDAQLHQWPAQDPPLALATPARCYADIPYGPHERERFDLIVPQQSAAGRPVVIFIHGGGFTGGDKDIAYSDEDVKADIEHYLAKGIAFASINYRLLDDSAGEGVLACLQSIRRSVQFIRYHADVWALDKARIGLQGRSAGAGAALWVGTQNDLAQPWNGDPVAQQSTRVQAVALREAQASYDLLRWESEVFDTFDFSFTQFVQDAPEVEENILDFYAIEQLGQLYASNLAPYRLQVDMLSFLSPDDPPIWVQNLEENSGPPTEKSQLNHHPLHAATLAERAAAVGATLHATAPALGIAPAAGAAADLRSFMAASLGR